MLKFGYKVITCPDCGSNDLQRLNSFTLLPFVIISFIFGFFGFYVVGIIIGIVITYFINKGATNDEKERKIWKVQCNTCHKLFEIPDPTLNKTISNESDENSTITKIDDKNNSEENKLKCSKCGADIKEGTKFCPECGNAVNNQ